MEVKRLKFLNIIKPDCNYMSGDFELVYTYKEAQHTLLQFYISLLVLTQVFIEKRLQSYFEVNQITCLITF